MKINPIIYGIAVIVIFFGAIGVAQAAGVWSISGKVTAGGEKVQLTSSNPDDVKGWMTIGDVAINFGIPLPELLQAFELPADTPATTAIKDLESDVFSTTNLRTWLKERTAK
jgi:hypothetical protein